MILLIPLGGFGDRFKKEGYKMPKALVSIAGKPIIFYLLESLNLKNIDFVYIPYNKEYIPFRFEQILSNQFPNIKFKFLILNEQTRGAAETINIALKELNINDCPILSLDSDLFFTTDIVNIWNGENKIVAIENTDINPIFSYIYGENGIIKDIVEKVKISDYACSGAYGFNSWKELLIYTQFILDYNIMQKNEFYTSTVIKEMIKDGIEFKYEVIDSNDWKCLGTPKQIKEFYFKNKFEGKSKICIDFDKVVMTYPKNGDIKTCEPVKEVIDFIIFLRELGNKVILHSNRIVDGRDGYVLSKIGKITFEQLEKFGIPFDDIYFGKPIADYYVNDCFEDMEKLIGFYKE